MPTTLDIIAFTVGGPASYRSTPAASTECGRVPPHGRIGVLKPDDRVELIHGYLVEKPVMTPPHAFAVTTLDKLFGQLSSADSSIVASAVADRSVGQSSRSRTSFWRGQRHPNTVDRILGPDDIALVVEVADSSLAFDRGRKAGSLRARTQSRSTGSSTCSSTSGSKSTPSREVGETPSLS